MADTRPLSHQLEDLIRGWPEDTCPPLSDAERMVHANLIERVWGEVWREVMPTIEAAVELARRVERAEVCEVEPDGWITTGDLPGGTFVALVKVPE